MPKKRVKKRSVSQSKSLSSRIAKTAPVRKRVSRPRSSEPACHSSSRQALRNFTGMGLAIGAACGIVFGTMFDNLGAGIALGTALGLTIGAGIDSRDQE